MNTRYALLAFLPLALACGPTVPPLSPAQRAEADKIKVARDAAAEGCVPKGEVSGGSSVANPQAIDSELQERAFRLGANYVRVTGGDISYRTGTAYTCP